MDYLASGASPALGFRTSGASHFWGFTFLGLHISGAASDLGLPQKWGFFISGAFFYFCFFLKFLGLCYLWGFLYLRLFIDDIGISARIQGFLRGIQQIQINWLLEPSQTLGLTASGASHFWGCLRNRASLFVGLLYFWGFFISGAFLFLGYLRSRASTELLRF